MVDMRTQTASTWEQMTTDERWLGWGYLGERDRCEDAALVNAADALASSQTSDWTYEERFAWANSKDGRWFGDCMFGGFPEQGAKYVRKQRD